MALELNALYRAVAALENAISVWNQKQADSSTLDMELEVIRAGVIQSFEFTYELCWKFMKRWLEENYGATGFVAVGPMTIVLSLANPCIL